MNKNRKPKKLTYDNQFRTLSIKVYEEQMPKGWEAVKQNIKVMDKSFWQVLAICHDRDPIGDDYWLPSIEKPHYHIIIRVLNDKRARVKQALDALGIVFREQVDKTLWENHGVESCANFTNMAVYLTHETDEAINDCKTKYELFEFVSNLSLEEIKQIREGYTRVSDSLEKVTPRKLAELDLQAYELGCSLGDFDRWYGSQPFSIRSQAKMRTIRESYERGVDERVESGETVARLCVFIQSEKNMGKTTAVKYALQKLGKRYLEISGEKTGKFDRLKVTHDAIIVNDDVCDKHLLNLADSTYVHVYRRNRNNPVWVGDYLIVTSNLSFEDWLWECGIHDKRQVEAARSRFYVCKLVKLEEMSRNLLYCDSQADRGGDDYLAELDRKFVLFRQYFDESLMEYAGTKTGKRKRVDVNIAFVYPSDGPEVLAIAAADEEERKRSVARYNEELMAEFEESIEEDMEYLDELMRSLELG